MAWARAITVENSFLVLFFHFFGVCRKANSVRRRVYPAFFPLFGVHAGKWICMRRRVSPVFSFQIRIRCRNAMAVINAFEFAVFDILGGTPILIVYHYLRVPGWFFCGSFLMFSAAWLAGLADRLAWQNCSVAVSWASPGG